MASDTPDNQRVPQTKIRNIRIDDDLWEGAMRIAKARRETLSGVIKRALVEYIEQHGGELE